MKLVSRKDYRHRRHLRLRQKISGTPDCPRMCVSISNRHVGVQFIDDINGVTMASLSTEVEDGAKKNVAGARMLGQKAAVLAKEKGIQKVTFDRGGRLYHGRLKALADAARESGLQF